MNLKSIIKKIEMFLASIILILGITQVLIILIPDLIIDVWKSYDWKIFILIFIIFSRFFYFLISEFIINSFEEISRKVKKSISITIGSILFVPIIGIFNHSKDAIIPLLILVPIFIFLFISIEIKLQKITNFSYSKGWFDGFRDNFFIYGKTYEDGYSDGSKFARETKK